MKRIIASVVIVLITAAFLSCYAIAPLRDFIISSIPQAGAIYSSIDSFFLNIWMSSLNGFVKINYVDYPYLPGVFLVSLVVIVFLIVFLVLSTCIYKARKSHVENLITNLREEKKKLNSDEVPPEFTHYDVNNVVFQNNSTPLISLENNLVNVASKDASFNISDKKYKPITRIVFSLIYILILLFVCFIAFIYPHNFMIKDYLKVVFEQQFVKFILDNFYSFFSSLAGNLNNVPTFTIYEQTIMVQDIIEVSALFLIGILLLVLILVVCHLVMIKVRKKTNYKYKIKELTKSVESDISNKNLSFFGYAAETQDVKGDVTYIAQLTKNDEEKAREEQMYKKASYIDDISEGVYSKGKLKHSGYLVEPSPVRKELTKEYIDEDEIKLQQDVTIEEIASIDDLVNNKKEEYSPIDSFVLPEDNLPYVDIDMVDLTSIAITKPLHLKEDIRLGVSDDIVFDQDGFSYLIKEGKPYIDDEEDISDVILDQDMDKTAIINRFGEETYKVLDELEPFSLDKLDYSIEENKRQNEIYNENVIKEHEEVVQELTKEEFSHEKEVEEVEEVQEAKEDIKLDEVVVEEKVEEPNKEVQLPKEEPSTVVSKPIHLVKPRKEIKPIEAKKVHLVKENVTKEENITVNTNIGVKLSPLDAFHQGITLVVPKIKPVIVKPIDKKKDKIIKPIDPQSFKSIEEEEIKKPVAKPNNGLAKPVSPIGVKKIDSKKFKN